MGVQVAFEIPENTYETDNLCAIKDNYKRLEHGKILRTNRGHGT